MLKEALQYPQLGMQDKMILGKVYDQKNVQELAQLFSSENTAFSYDKNISALAGKLNQTTPPKTKKVVKPTKESTTTTSTTTITIDGKTMGPDEFEAYLNEHPELKDIPQMQELLKKMKEK